MGYDKSEGKQLVKLTSTQSCEAKLVDLGFNRSLMAVELMFVGPEWEELFQCLAEAGHQSADVLFYAGATIDRLRKRIKYGGGFRSSVAFPRHRAALARFFKCGIDEVQCGVLKRLPKIPRKGDNDTLSIFINGIKIEKFFADFAPIMDENDDDDWEEGVE